MASCQCFARRVNPIAAANIVATRAKNPLSIQGYRYCAWGCFSTFCLAPRKTLSGCVTQPARSPQSPPAAIVPSVAADIARRPALADRFRHLDRRRGVLAPRQLGAHRRTELLETRMVNCVLLQPQIELEAFGGGTQHA